jgi:hypothetical protein
MTGEVLHDLPPAAAVGGGRAEIDTSAPFESVREAVDRFGGSAAWSSHLVRRIFAHHKVNLTSSPPLSLPRQILARITFLVQQTCGAADISLLRRVIRPYCRAHALCITVPCCTFC